MPNISSLDRLKSQLLTTGLQQKDNGLFQVINQLIDFIRQSIDFTAEQIAELTEDVAPVIAPVQQRVVGIPNFFEPEPDERPFLLQGKQGIQGPRGLQGAPGIDGEDADFHVIPGPIGPPGPAGAGSSGHMYNDNVDTTVVITVVDTFVTIPSGFSSGQLDGFTFNGTNLLVCGRAGKYLIVYSVSLRMDIAPSKTIETAVMINGVANIQSTNHSETSIGGINNPQTISGNVTINLVVGDTIGIGVSNHDDTVDVVVSHGNLSVFSAAGPAGQSLAGPMGLDGLDAEAEIPVPLPSHLFPTHLVEHGLWTPVIGGTTSEIGQSYSVQDGHYVRIGNFIAAWFAVTLSNAGTITGAVLLKGLPFPACNSDAAFRSICPINWSALNTAAILVQGAMAGGNSYINLFISTVAVTSLTATALQPADVTNTTRLVGSLCYVL